MSHWNRFLDLVFYVVILGTFWNAGELPLGVESCGVPDLFTAFPNP